VIYKVADIMANQLRFHQTKGRRAHRFSQQKSFPDAFLYFKISAKIHQRDSELLAFWDKLRQSSAHQEEEDSMRKKR
jgi:hypothetical protein